MLPNVLVISSDPFSKENANGRTLGNLFYGYPTDQIAQLFLNDAPLDMIDCRYFQISDQMMLDHFRRFKKVGIERKYSSDPPSFLQNTRPSVRKNPWTCLLRDRLWRTKAWSTQSFWVWVNSFKPSVVLLQANDMPYLYDLAKIVADKTNSKLVMYNSEDYYFKTWNYLRDENGHKSLYPKFHKRLCKAFKKAFDASSYVVYNSEYLKRDYEAAGLTKPSEVIYMSSDWVATPYVPKEGRFQVTYFGNLSDGRTKSILELADGLASLRKPYSFDVYGTAFSQNDLAQLKESQLLHYHEPVPYFQLQQIARDSDLLVHVESSNPFIAKDRKNAFSTKIADCLASGRLFLLYAPKEMAQSRYLLENRCGLVASTKEELVGVLKRFLKNPSLCAKNEIEVAAKRRSLITNADKFKDILSALNEADRK